MIKKLDNSNIDEIMDFWKSESIKLDNSLKSRNLTDKYNNAIGKFSASNMNTTIYTEEDNICGYVAVENKSKILSILVKETMRREGIGTVLIQNCKKEFEKLSVDVPKKNRIVRLFFEKNGFKMVDVINDEFYCMEWNKSNESTVKLLYFDDDINENYLKESLKIPYERIDVKSIIEECKIDNLEVYNIKSYMKFRKKFENIMNSEKILLYIDYNNYYKFLDDQIKDIAKIKRIDLNILVCEPFSIENSKKDSVLEQIEESYKNYNIIKIDCSLNSFTEDVTINQIFYKRMEVLSKKIQEIAQNI